MVCAGRMLTLMVSRLQSSSGSSYDQDNPVKPGKTWEDLQAMDLPLQRPRRSSTRRGTLPRRNEGGMRGRMANVNG